LLNSQSLLPMTLGQYCVTRIARIVRGFVVQTNTVRTNTGKGARTTTVTNVTDVTVKGMADGFRGGVL